MGGRGFFLLFSYVNLTTSQFTNLLGYLESYDPSPSFITAPHPLAPSASGPSPTTSLINDPLKLKSQRDPRIGKEAAIYVGHMKGWQGNLVDINRNSARIEVPGRNPPFFTAPLGSVVLL